MSFAIIKTQKRKGTETQGNDICACPPSRFLIIFNYQLSIFNCITCSFPRRG